MTFEPRAFIVVLILTFIVAVGGTYFSVQALHHHNQKKMTVSQLLRAGKVTPNSQIVFKDGTWVTVLNPRVVSSDGPATVICDERKGKGAIRMIKMDDGMLEGARVVPHAGPWHAGHAECPAREKTGPPKRKAALFFSYLYLITRRIPEGVGPLPDLLYVHALLRADLLRRIFIADLVELDRLRILAVLDRLLCIFHVLKIEFILHAAVDRDLLRPVLQSFDEKNAPRNDEDDDHKDRNAARDDLALVFRAIFEVVYRFLNDHTVILLRTRCALLMR